LCVERFGNWNLHRVPTAKHTHPLRQAVRSFEKVELSRTTTSTRLIARTTQSRRRECTRCEIKPNEPRIHCIRPARLACDPSQDKRRFKRTNNSRRCRKNAHGVARFDLADRRRLWRDAAETGRLASFRRKKRRHSAESDRASVNQRYFEGDRTIIQYVTRFEVVETVHEHVMFATDAKRVVTSKIIDNGPHSSVGANLHQTRLRSLRLRSATICIALCKECLPLQIRTIDHIAINDRDCSNTRSNELLTHHGAECTTTRDQHLRLTEATLPRFAESGETHLTSESVEGVLHGVRG
jgi:hypothetical protein